jgi:hypothetical protein
MLWTCLGSILHSFVEKHANPGARLPWKLNFVQWHLISVGPQDGRTWFMSPFWWLNFEVAPRCSKMCTSLLYFKKTVGNNRTFDFFCSSLLVTLQESNNCVGVTYMEKYSLFQLQRNMTPPGFRRLSALRPVSPTRIWRGKTWTASNCSQVINDGRSNQSTPPSSK